MNPRRDAATVPTAPEPEPEPEDILVRYARLGMERARGRGRYVAGGFVVASGPGRAEVHQQAQQQQAQQALPQQLAARGLTIESGAAGPDTRMDEFRHEQTARQHVERAMRDEIGRRIPGKGM